MKLKTFSIAWTKGYTSLISIIGKSLIAIIAIIGLNIVNMNTPGDPFRDGKVVVFLFAFALIGSFWIMQRFDFFLGLAHALISFEWLTHYEMVFGILLVFGSIGMLVLADYLKSIKGTIIFLLRLSVLIQLGYSVLQACGMRFFGATDPAFNYLLQGTLGSNVVAGAFFAAMVPFAFKFWTPWEGLILAVACLFSSSTMAVLALAGAFLYYLWRLRGRDAIILGSICAVVCILGAIFLPQVEFFSFSGRFLPWARAWELIKQNPWGYGPGSWNGLYPLWQVNYPRRWDFLHNEWLQLLFECGWPALVLLLIGSYRVLCKIEIWAGSVVAAILVNSLGLFPLHLCATSFVLCIALALGTDRRDNKPLDNGGLHG